MAVDMTCVGFIGSGRIGGTIARLATTAGYDAVLSNSRGPQTLRDVDNQTDSQKATVCV